MLLLVAILAAIVWVAWANKAPVVTKINVASARLPVAFDGYRIAQISDLHNASFGRDNERLLGMLAETNPDAIMLTGDLVDSRHTDWDIALQFAKRAAEIAPIYYVSGNHEARLAAYPAFAATLADRGVTVLCDARTTLVRGGQTIALIGLEDPGFFTAAERNAATTLGERLRRIAGEESAYTVLLAHHPEYFAVYAAQGVDLSLCGHAHGGQFRLPLLGGVAAPGQGFFPAYDAGLYRNGGAAMVVSRGLGNSVFPFRINNRPEIVLLTLVREEKE